MEREGTLLCSQEHAANPYHEPDESRPQPPIHSLMLLILSSPIHLGLPSGLLASYFLIRTPY
jgi:hypothetical protein